MTSAVVAFVADIPADLSPEQLAKLYAWTQSKFKLSQISMNADGSSYTLSAMCPDGSTKTKRHYQSLLGTNLKHWGVEHPKGQRWLRAVSAEEYQLIIKTPDFAAPTPASSPSSEQNECEDASPKMLPDPPMSGSAQVGGTDASSAHFGLQLPRNLLTQRRMVRSC